MYISGTYSGLDYSSAEDEDFPAPIATKRGGRAPVIVRTDSAGRNGSGGGNRGGRGEEGEGAVTSRVTRRSSRNNSRCVCGGGNLQERKLRLNLGLELLRMAVMGDLGVRTGEICL